MKKKVTRIRADLRLKDSGLTPSEQGEELANHVLGLKHNFHRDSLEIDMRGVKSGVMISAFFANFFKTLYKADPSCSHQLTEIQWMTDHDFQKETIDRMAAPYDTDAHCISVGIRKLDPPDTLSVGVPPGHDTPTLFATFNGDTVSLPIAPDVAEVLIAHGIAHEG